MNNEAVTSSSPFADSTPPPSSKQPELKRALSSIRRKYASDEDAIEGLTAFVRSLGVEHPASTENELLMQAAPYMSESLASNLQNAWTPEERARLDAAPVPAELDHQNRDHEYIFVSFLPSFPSCSILACNSYVSLSCHCLFEQQPAG